jgi:3-hydroxybutyryl-CoA dehydrogenase
MNPLSTSVVVAVVGAGAMGAGIAQVAAAAGHPVKLLDQRPEAAELAVAGIRAQFSKMADKGKLGVADAQAASARLTAVSSLADLADAGLVIEAIVENLGAKQALYRDLEALVPDDCLLATNTSSISVTAIGAALMRPERLAGLHFFNPAPLMALVEVVSGLATDPAVAQTLFATALAWGKRPVHAKSTPGFIVNRVARPYYAEALRVLGEGAADVATVDACCREAGGFRMGPFELMDMIGHDVNLAVTRSVWQAFYNDPRFLPSLIQQELVDAGFLGKKTGRGFYDYRADALRPLPATEPAHTVTGDIVLYGDSPVALALAARLRAHDITVTTVAANGELIAEVGGAQVFVTDGRTATRRAAEIGVPNVVLIDLALDYLTTTRLAVTVADSCNADSAAQAMGVLQNAGIAVSHVGDLPGLIVMRTVAMLANEAADAVNQGVCDAASVDLAMRQGVNDPCGPLAWADALGLPTLNRVLGHLGLTYGEDRYRVSPLIQHKVFSGKNFHG